LGSEKKKKKERLRGLGGVAPEGQDENRQYQGANGKINIYGKPENLYSKNQPER